MKNILTLVITFFALTTFGQQMTSEQWDEEAKTNIRLLPKYGHIPKTEEQQKLDQKFIDETIQQEKFKGDKTAASNHMISLGFNYLVIGTKAIARTLGNIMTFVKNSVDNQSRKTIRKT